MLSYRCPVPDEENKRDFLNVIASIYKQPSACFPCCNKTNVFTDTFSVPPYSGGVHKDEEERHKTSFFTDNIAKIQT